MAAKVRKTGNVFAKRDASQVRSGLADGGKWIRTSSSARETRPYGSAYDPEAEIFGLSLLGCARSVNALVFLDGAQIVRPRCAPGNFQDGPLRPDKRF
jgi:hypothetical protein